eukprot:CAMPEP_0195520936 /NCGR_PEP_ID=MMETSP0794_2-20130614/17648_1 /TAXON_ID=515487 /ORGANISM="Stephanopyxis turris, Strain CCMP 815" /LENGTH=169 /DNA_ID=CAMNT_0040650383 /DNA_START=226 /DNA_END=735 /DNA_ORIENTATION=+
MGVNELAIEAHEKGDAETDTINYIVLTDTTVKIKKSSRVNDLWVELTLGQTERKRLSDGRTKTSSAVSDNLRHVKIISSMPTINGNATVTDVKTLLKDVDKDGGAISLLKQELTVKNELTNKSHTTTRFFVPHEMDDEDITPPGSEPNQNSRENNDKEKGDKAAKEDGD